jgi:hypothetical protein
VRHAGCGEAANWPRAYSVILGFLAHCIQIRSVEAHIWLAPENRSKLMQRFLKTTVLNLLIDIEN